MIAIKNQVTDWFESGYPDVYETKKAEIDQAIAAIQDDYSNNIFPFMKANWKEYPNNIGHMESDGCYRCHNDRHATTENRTISKDCSLCHNIIAQGTRDSMQYSTAFEALDFQHPVDIAEAWRTEMCSMCHTALY
jgi:hypothetical protein